MRLDPGDVALCVADDGPPTASGARPAATPIVQTSLFAHPDLSSLTDALAAEHASHVYTRGQNPTVETLERKLALLEGGEACKAFASGMAAVSAVLMGLLEAGDHVLFVNHTYGPTLQLAEHLGRFGITHSTVLDVSPEAVAAALRPETKLVWLESPGTMLFRLVDVAAVAELARKRGVLTCMDNSWATPLLQKPLALGVDMVVHSATKYLGGHSDVVAGALVTSAARLQRIFYRAYLLNGGALAPFNAFLVLRGLRTLPVRLRQHEADALEVARYLETHDAVAAVHHPALREPELAARQLAGTTGLFSFELADASYARVRRFIDALEHFRIGVSWGGVESLVITPSREDNAAALTARGIPPGLVRLSVGLESAELLIADLDQALSF
ncbi:MAG: aminotransferase class I/II-fold pyridoxal phosphate-dependent enzyme [Gemmatimonadota bacterium]